MMHSILPLLCLTLASALLVMTTAQTVLPSVTHSGYLSTNKSDDSELFYAYYEAQDADQEAPAPVLLWLQVSTGLP